MEIELPVDGACKQSIDKQKINRKKAKGDSALGRTFAHIRKDRQLLVLLLP